MNGVTSQSMREKGADYHINWGVSLGHLIEMSREYEKDYDLALALWKENVRECKILATMLMPPERFDSDLAILWVEQLTTQEVAEFLAFNLLQHVPYASDLAMQLLAERNELPQICAYNLLARLFMKQIAPGDRDINEFIDQAQAAMEQSSLPLKVAVQKAVLRFAELGTEYEMIANSSFKNVL